MAESDRQRQQDGAAPFLGEPTFVPVHPEEVPKDLICSICFQVPLQPALTRPCQHWFCQPCLKMAADTSRNRFARHYPCPVCRQNVTCDAEDWTVPEQSLLYRIWANTHVKCKHNDDNNYSSNNNTPYCGWSGPVVDAMAHAKVCKAAAAEAAFSPRALLELQRVQEALEKAQDQVAEKTCEIHTLSAENDSLRDQLETAHTERIEALARLERHLEHLQRLQQSLDIQSEQHIKEQQLQRQRHVQKYDRFMVKELAALIVQHLENKPPSIDRNHIFNCISVCYRDLQRDWNDNPQHYKIDMRLLVTAATSSNWFTENQLTKLCQWRHQLG